MKPVSLTLVLCVGLSTVLQTWGLEFHMNSTQDNLTDQLTCSSTTNQSDKDIFTMIDISIIDFTHPRNKLKLASASILEKDLYVQHTRNIKMKVSGSVSQYEAKLDIKFSKESQCELGSYLCELTFINLAGQIDKAHAAVKARLPHDISDFLSHDPQLAYMDQISTTANQLAEAMSQMNGTMSQLAVATAQMEDATKQIANAVNKQVDIKNPNTDCTDQMEEILVQLSDRFTAFETALMDRMTSLLDKYPQNKDVPQNNDTETNEGEQYIDLMDTGEKEWRLAFRGTANINKSVLDAYKTGTHGVDIEPGCKQVTTKMPCSNHYRNNDVLDKWQNTDEVALVLYDEGVKVKQIIFDAAGTSFMDWFQRGNLKNSSWDDLTRTARYNYFSITGHSRFGRRFFINFKYGRCPNDAGWFMAKDEQYNGCPYDSRETFPNFFYSEASTMQMWATGDINSADVMAVFVKYHTSEGSLLDVTK